ncbi:molybdate ABC transporter substrate-binding protein [Candidatus Clostridium radicumherbarum]|uniref:Molybdate ABC transporter substrate-binding protein n=1 Tax=Candidatus Clostridium radicumherbarum TaxID=3381662 RepID=A0ABW8TNS7_9CLOT
MNKSLKIITTSLITASILLLSGCGKNTDTSKTPPADTTQPSAKVTLTISAASSLKNSLDEIKNLYTAANPNINITYNYGASGALQQQIEQGAAVDIFLSAATKQMDALDSKGLLLKDTKKNLLLNDVVLVVPKDSTAISAFKNLTSDKVKKIALGEPKSVPAGQYAEEVFTKLGILDKVKAKAVYGKDVKEVLSWVETGNADAGVVYATDAKISTKVKILETASSDTHSPIVYPEAVIKDSKNVDAAKDFLKFLSDDKAKAVFEKYGFKLASK